MFIILCSLVVTNVIALNNKDVIFTWKVKSIHQSPVQRHAVRLPEATWLHLTGDK